MSILSYIISSVVPLKISQLLGYTPKHLSTPELFFETINSYTLYTLVGHSAVRYFDGAGAVIGYGFEASAGFLPQNSIKDSVTNIGKAFYDMETARKVMGYELACVVSQYGARALDHGLTEILGIEGSNTYIARSAVIGAWLGRALEAVDTQNLISTSICNFLGLKQGQCSIQMALVASGALVGAFLSIYDGYTYVPPVEEKGYVANMKDGVVDCISNARDTAIDYAEQIKNDATTLSKDLYNWCSDLYYHWGA